MCKFVNLASEVLNFARRMHGYPSSPSFFLLSAGRAGCCFLMGELVHDACASVAGIHSGTVTPGTLTLGMANLL